MDDVVKSAKVNKRMPYHYFESKKGLYRAVFLNQWGDLKKWFDESLGDDRSEITLLRVLTLYSNFLATHQDFVRLMMWEALEGGAISRSIWNEIRGPIFRQIEELVVTSQKNGILDRAFSPGHFIVSFLGIVTFYFAYAPTIVDIIGPDPLSKTALRARQEQVQLILKGLLK